MSAALRADDIRYTYPARRRQPAVKALDGVSLEVRAGERVALLGPNGSGKSTFLKIVCGGLRADAGTIELFGRSGGRKASSDLGIVFQNAALDPHMTVLENLRLQATLYGLRRADVAARIEAALKQARVEDRAKTLVKRLSPGLARRVDLIRAVLHEPRLLILDEPTVGLDPVARRSYLEMLDRRRHDNQLATVMSTHLVDEASGVDRVVLMHEGRVVANDDPSVLTAQLGPRIVSVLDEDWTPDNDGWLRIDGGWRRRRVDSDTAQAISARLAAAGVAYTVAPPTLADVFEEATGSLMSEIAA